MSELSAVVVPVPEAEPLVGALRAELDPVAAAGVPAHVTVMFPFVEPGAIDDELVAALGEAVAGVEAFDAVLDRVEWFGTEVLWLAPEPADRFAALTAAVSRRFGITPYGGRYEPVPHLTVGNDAPLQRLRAAAEALADAPAIHTRVHQVALMTGDHRPRSWHTVAALPLHTRS